MQVFLPYPSFGESAAALDYKRLGKQRVETLQIMKAIHIPTYGWQNHPVTKMWRGYAAALLDYQYFTCNEWTKNRGYKDGCLRQTIDIYEQFYDPQDSLDDPWWLKNPDLFVSHQSNLIRKDPMYYEPQFPGVPPDIDYWWPVL